ncbi:MAG TPA: hypothetical protein VN666_21970 [Nitrospira sp.]|nr:hypothetical protein [Nitrospira sp.]
MSERDCISCKRFLSNKEAHTIVWKVGGESRFTDSFYISYPAQTDGPVICETCIPSQIQRYLTTVKERFSF